MLGNPYQLVHRENDVLYHYLEVGDSAFIAVEHVMKTDDGNELTISVTQLPLVSPILALLGAFAECVVVRVDDPTNGEDPEAVEKIYSVVDVPFVRKYLRDAVNKMKEETPSYTSRFDYESELRAYTVKRLRDDGDYSTYYSVEMDSRVTNVWLAKSTKFGVLALQSLILVGRDPKNAKITMMSTFLLSIETASKIVDFIKTRMSKPTEETTND